MSSSSESAGAVRPTKAFFDAHTHLHDEWLLPYREKIVDQLQALPVKGAVVNGTGEEDWPAVSEWSRQFPWVIPSFGLHPWWVGKRSPQWLEALKRFLEAFPTAGVGEIGLDRWILERARPDDPRLEGLPRASLAEQREVFTAQLQIAAQHNRAASIHCLDAWGALWEVMQTSSVPDRGFLLHAYGGPADRVAGFVERGAYFSFNGAFLAERKERQQQVFRALPLDRLLVETDAPAMPPPQAWRTHKLPPGPGGTPLNHPGNIEAAYTGLAALRGMPVAELSEAVEANFRRLFRPD